jgi:hypothetical protein
MDSAPQMISASRENRTYYDSEKKMSFLDKRYLPRWEVKNRIAYQMPENLQEQEAFSHDLSSVGICLRTAEPLPLDKKVKLNVHLTEETSFPAEGRVVWSQAVADGNILNGILFEKISPQSQELILKHAFEFNHDALVKHWFKGWEE